MPIIDHPLLRLGLSLFASRFCSSVNLITVACRCQPQSGRHFVIAHHDLGKRRRGADGEDPSSSGQATHRQRPL
jgi:hypothetical protein